MEKNVILQGNCLDVLKTLPDKSVNCCITSPPYWGLRNYGMEEQIGLEETPEKYVERLVNIFNEVKRILTDDGTCWVNIGDTYNASSYRKDVNSSGHGKQGTNKGSYENVVERPTDKNSKPKDLIGIPWLFAFAMRESGWYLRQDIIWNKPNPMPEPVKDRFTSSHEYVFLFSKRAHYYFDHDAVQEKAVGYDGRKDTVCKGSAKYGYETFAGKSHERWKYDKNNSPMRNKRDVWTVTPSQYKWAHFATFPEELIYPMVVAGCPVDGTVLDIFFGSGTTGVVAKKNNRNYIGIELNPEYIEMAEKRLNGVTTKLF